MQSYEGQVACIEVSHAQLIEPIEYFSSQLVSIEMGNWEQKSQKLH